MFKAPTYLLAACVLAACSGNPFDPDTTDGGTDGGTTPPPTTDPISGDGLPPGTVSPTPNSAIVRYEARGTGDTEGNGYANGFRYDSTTNTFFVEGLAFDGDQPDGTPYTAAAGVSLPTGFAAYEGPSTVPDFLTGTPIDQLSHRVVYGASTSGQTQLAIVRTGAYAGYGFGGFVYQRNQVDGAGVVLPTQGQATYTGNYAGLRDFIGAGGLEYVRGNASVSIDFDGFSGNCTPTRCTDAVRGVISDRRVFDITGAEITDQLVTAINTQESLSLTGLPVLTFKIGTGVLNSNGEIIGEVSSNVGPDVFEEGNYYAIMAGDHTTLPGGEIVGIVVVEGEYPGLTDVSFRETGGFLVTR